MNLVKKADIPSLDDLLNSGSDSIPKDYEPCGECGYDHAYEYEEAKLWHEKQPQKQPPAASSSSVPSHRFDEEKPGRHMSEILEDVSFAKDDKEKDDEDDGESEDTEVVISIVEEGDEPQIFKFDLPVLPGSEISEFDLEVEEPEDEEVVVEEKDMWDWKSRGLSNFLVWLSDMFKNIPKHSGHDTSGLERVIAYLSNLDKEISKAVRSDIRGQIDVNKVEEARSSIKDGIERCNNRLDRLTGKGKKKTKKKADFESGIVKEAQKAPYVGGMVVTVPLFISRLARICINGSISAGHDIEDMFKKLVKKYDLDKREQAELLQLLEDMNYPVLRDRGFDTDETFDRTSEDGFDWSAQYYA